MTVQPKLCSNASRRAAVLAEVGDEAHAPVEGHSVGGPAALDAVLARRVAPARPQVLARAHRRDRPGARAAVVAAQPRLGSPVLHLHELRSFFLLVPFAEWQSCEDGENSQCDEQRRLGSHVCFSSLESLATLLLGRTSSSPPQEPNRPLHCRERRPSLPRSSASVGGGEAMSNGDVEAGGPARAAPTTGIKPPPGRYNMASNGPYNHMTSNGPYVPPSPFYYDHAAAHERHHWSWLVPLVVLANVAMFLVVMFYNDCPRSGGDCVGRGFLRRFSFQPLKENPLLGPSAATLQKYGGLDWQKVVHGNQAWRLESCTWLHAGLIHLLANMISLIFIGVRLEQQFGFWKVGLVYLVSGFGGSVLSVLFIRKGVSVGASGALFGLLGAMLSELITNWTIYTNRFAAMVNLIIIAAINLALGILPHVDNFAHIGGFATGFLLGFVLLIQPQFGWLEQPFGGKSKYKYKAYQIILLLVALVLLIAGLAVGLLMVFRGENGNDHCSWCHYLTCVPTSSWKCDN